MVIGYIGNIVYPPRSGGSIHMYQKTWGLAQRGHRIISHRRNQNVPYIEHYRTRGLLNFVKDFDLMYIRIDGAYGKEVYSACKLLTLWSKPLVWEVNSPLEERLPEGKLWTKVSSLNARRRCFAKLVDAGICVSEQMREYAKDFLGIENVYVVPNGSDERLFSPENRSDEVYGAFRNQFKVLWVGSPGHPWQGMPIVWEVARRMYGIDKDIVFIFVGKKQEFSLPLESNMVVIDQMDYTSVPPFIASADVGICLRTMGIDYGSPLKLFDYMASGLAVIATSSGQIRSVIRDSENGFLTDNDTEDIMEKILYLKDNPDKRRDFARRAREDICKYYNWRRAAEETENVLKSLV